MTTNTLPTRRVELVLDLICIHSYLGFVRLSRAVERYRDQGGEVQIVFRPFQVAPDAPAEGKPLFDVHREAFGEEQARAIAEDTSFGAEDGIEAHFDKAVHVNTFEAHRLLAAAAEQGRGEQMAERLFRAYLTDGLNIGDADTLRRLAAEAGAEPAEGGAEELRAGLAEIRRAGVTAVPLFLFDTGRTISGAQSEETFSKALQAPAGKD
ncbi:DsbA family oxidoreductase [Streptomyces poriticola]|uniref:DsbA family oxidoreductase n=1 Tax=Streptomyces poriticola TaxID=3120506 RepID=UPI002FCDF66F